MCLCLFVFWALPPFSAHAGDATLQWTPTADAAYYVVYWGTGPGQYSQTSANIPQPSPLPSQITHTVSGLTDGTTYYFAVKAFNPCDQSSDFSPEVSKTVTDLGEGVPLQWTPAPDAAYYVVYWGTGSGQYTQNSANIPQPSPLPSQMAYTVSGLTGGITYYFAVKAFNACDQASDFTNEVSKAITVGNLAPTADAGADQQHPETTGGVPTTITLNGANSSDPDGTISAYHWARVDSHTNITTILSSTTAASPSFNAPSVTSSTTLEFQLTVTDNNGTTATDRVRVTVTNVNKAPTASAGPDQTRPETTDGSPTTVSLNGTASSDPDGSIASYAWTRTDSTPVFSIALQNAGTATPSFAAPAVTTSTSFEFALTVTDNEGATATDRVRVTVTNVNRPPTANAGPDLTVPETSNGVATSVSLSGTGSSDSDGTVNSYAWVRTDNTPGFSITLQNAETATPSFTAPAVTTATPFEFQLTVTDNEGATATDRVKVTVTNINKAPTASAGPDQTHPETTDGSPTTVSLNGTGSTDPDGSITRYAWTRTDSTPGFSITLQNADTATPSFAAPAVTTATSFEFQVTVTDNEEATATDRVLVTVTNVNQPPTASAGSNQTLPETTDGSPTTVTLNGTGSSDPDGSISSYAWTRTDTHAEVTISLQNADTATPSFTAPAVTADTTFEFELTVTDDEGEAATSRVGITITPVNEAPTANAGPDQTLPETTDGSPTTVTLNGTGSTDPDGAISSYAWARTDGTPGFSITLENADTATPSFKAPAVTATTVFEFELTVTDPTGATGTDRVRITITNINQPPTANAGPDRTHPEITDGSPTTVTLSGTGSSDPDGSISSYAWARTDTVSGISIPLTGADTATPSFAAPSVTADTVFEFELTVTDNNGATATDRVRITITHVNQPPTANAGPDQTRPETTDGSPTTVTLSGTGSSDPDGTIVSYAWARTDVGTGISIVLSGADTATPIFAAPAVTGDTPFEFELTVTDNNGATATDRVRVTVTDVNQPPSANAGPDQAPPETTDGSPTTVTLNGTGSSDPDGSISSYAWTRTDTVSGISIALAGADTATPSFTAPSVTADTPFEFELTVTDSQGATATDRVRITVTNVNQAPTASAGPDQTHPETINGAPTTVTLNGTGSSDPDGTLSQYAWARTDTHEEIALTLQNADTATPSFAAPGVTADTGFEFELTVTDNEGATATDRVRVTITRVNQEPLADAGPAQTVQEGVAVTLNGTGSSDPDGRIAGWLWEQVPTPETPSVPLSGADTPTASFTAPEVDPSGASFTFKLTVTDEQGATNSATTIVNVTFDNQPPVANAGADQTVNEGVPVTLTAAASTDPDDGIASYSWTQTQGTSVALSSARDVTPTFEAPMVTSAGEKLVFQVTVTDQGGLSSTDTAQVLVENVNEPPTANAGVSQTHPETTNGVPTAVTLNGKGSSDADGTLTGYAWRRVDTQAGFAITLENAATATPTFSAPAVTASTVFTFELSVTDNDGATDTDQVMVTITNVNQPPTANAGPDQAQPETTNGNPSVITLNGNGSKDEDGTISRYSWRRSDSLTGTTTVIENPETPSPFFVSPDVDADTPLEFELTVTDNDGATAQDTVRVTLTRVNRLPVADAGPDQAVNERSQVTLSGANSSDPDGTLSSWLWKQEIDPEDPVVTLSGASTETATFTAPDVTTDGASLTFRLTVTDNDGATHSATTIVNVTFDNQPPIAQAGPDQTVAEGVTVTLSADNSSDPDNDPIAAYFWELLNGPPVALDTPEAATARFTAPDVGPAGSALTFRVTVTDSGGLSASDEIIINVTFDNQPPTANAGPDQTVSEEETVTLSAAGSVDPDDGIDAYKWSQTSGSPVRLSDSTAITPTFTAPSVEAAGSQLTFTVTVTDTGGLTSSDTVLINISNENHPPVAEAGKKQSVREAEEVTLSAAGSSDPDGTIAAYQWVQTSGPAITLSDATSVSPVFTAPTVDKEGVSLTFELKVTDNEGLSATDQVIVNVLNANKPPVAKAKGKSPTEEKKTATLSGEESSDPDNGIETYLWEQTSGSTVTLTDPSASVTSFTAPEVTSSGETLAFRLRVTDTGGLSATDEIALAVVQANRPPVASAGPNQKSDAGTLVTLSGEASHDPDNNLASYLWEQTGGPFAVTLAGADTVSATFTAPFVDIKGAILRFRLTVTDSQGLTASDTSLVQIRFVNQPPVAHAGGDQAVHQGSTVTLDGSASRDPEGDISSWAWAQSAGPPVTLTTPEEPIAHFVAPQSTPGGIQLVFTLTVTDNDGLSHIDSCTVKTTFEQSDPTDETTNASIELLDNQLRHQDWLSIGWGAYRKANNEARVASGDLDGDGTDELVIGLGPVDHDTAMPGGFFQIVSHDYKHLAWGQIPWAEYNDFNGETWPACGDLDGDGVDEIVVGLGKGGQGQLAIFSYSRGHVTHHQWASVPWEAYNDAHGETRPACGNIDSDACMEIIVGLGSDPDNGITSNGRYAILDKACDWDLSDGYELKAWGQGTWEEYNDQNGSTWPSCGDIDGDGQDEILLGLGPGGGGKTEIVTYGPDAPSHLGWLTVDWDEYNTLQGETRPATSDINQDGIDEVIVGLGPVPGDDQIPGGRFPIMTANQLLYQWGQLSLEPYNRTNGESRPAPFTANGESYLIIGKGTYAPDADTDEETETPTDAEKSQAECFINTCRQRGEDDE